MADYAIITNHTDYGMELIKSDPSMASKLGIEANTKVRDATNGNYGISNVYIDFDGRLTYYDLEPLTPMAQMEMHQASLGIASFGWLETIKKIISVIVAVVAFVVGVLVGGWALLAGAIIAAGVLLWSYLTSQMEYKQEMTEINQEYARQYAEGEITKEQYDEFVRRKEKVMEEKEEIPWKLIIIGALVGFGALAALFILTRKR